MRDSVRKQDAHAMLMQLAACAAVLFATIFAAHTPRSMPLGSHTLADAEKAAALRICRLEVRDTRSDAIEQVRSEAMLRARQAYGDEK